MSEKFLCDTNFWISCANELYPLEHFPTYWKVMERLLANKTILLHWSVVDELKNKDDRISKWIAERLKNETIQMINKPTNVPKAYIEVCTWPKICSRPLAGSYKEDAIKEFCDEKRADAWLCAQAYESDFTLVTRERPQPQIVSKVKIPDVCKGMNIKCMNFNDFFDVIDLTV